MQRRHRRLVLQMAGTVWFGSVGRRDALTLGKVASQSKSFIGGPLLASVSSTECLVGELDGCGFPMLNRNIRERHGSP